MTSRRYCQLQIGLLGSFNLVVDGARVSSDVWSSKKAFMLLKYLAARPGKRVPTDVLIDLLWPDDKDTDRTSNLHTAVWFVRRILTSQANSDAEAPLRYENGSYWLDIDRGCVDAEQFRRHVMKSRELATRDPEMALFHCESALELYRDDFLCEEVYEEWTISFRDDYKELYFETIKRSAELMMEHRDNLEDAIRVCRLGVKKDPFREEYYQLGIKAYILAERYVDAMNLYKKYSKMLMDEFQLEPSPATQALVAHLCDKTGEEAATLAPDYGAYICDRAMLQFHLDTELRRSQRTGTSFSLLLIASQEGTRANRQMKTTFHILQRSLRNSDLICLFSENLIVVFLPDTTRAASEVLWDRLADTLEERNIDTSSLSLTLLSNEEWDDMKKELARIFAE